MHTVRSPQSHDQLAKLFFFFNDTATTEIYTLSLHDALPIYHAVLRILSVPDEGPDPVDHPLGLFGLPLPVRQGPQALQQLLFLVPGLLPSLLEAPLAGARLEVLDVAEDQRQDRKSTRLNSSHANISYAVFCLKKKNQHLRRRVDRNHNERHHHRLTTHQTTLEHSLRDPCHRPRQYRHAF